MAQLLDTFLHHQQFNQIVSTTNGYLQELITLPKEKRIKRIRQLFAFNKIFTTDSVQGIAGLVNIDTKIEADSIKDEATKAAEKLAKLVIDEDRSAEIREHSEDEVKRETSSESIIQPIVFKLSVEINRTVEHEYFVLKKLNTIRKFCPNFVGTVGLLNGYVCSSFFETKQPSSNIFEVKQNGVPNNYLLLEYVSDITFRHVCKYASKAAVTSAILSILCALQIAQNKLQFTHYDLHSDNILMRQVEPDSYFAYVINGEVMWFPTFGWYPVMIDMGSSYIRGIEERSNRTSISHYHRGLQSTEYDPLGDVHHFLLSAVSRLETEDKQSDEFCRHFRLIAMRMMHLFRHSSIWRHKGWKQLPCNIYYLFNEAVTATKAVLSPFYTEMQVAVVETIALGVQLPFAEYSKEDIERLLAYYYPQLASNSSRNEEAIVTLLRASIEDISHFVDALDQDPLSKSDIIILYTLRALVEHAALIQLPANLLSSSTSCTSSSSEISLTFSAPKEVVNAFKQATHTMYPHYSYKLDLARSFRGAHCVAKVMRHLLFNFNQPNLSKMKEWYSHLHQKNIRGPLDVAKFIKQNSAIRYDFNEASTLYVWNSDKEKHIKTTFGDLHLPSKILRAYQHSDYKHVSEAISKIEK